jgi:hypothetical protein
MIAASAATAAATSLPAAAAADPIFAVIERDRAADAAWLARAYFEQDLEEAGHKLTPAPGDWRTAELANLVEEHRALRAELAKTVPTTLAGLVALLEYVREKSPDEFYFTAEEDLNEQLDFLDSLTAAVHSIALHT